MHSLISKKLLLNKPSVKTLNNRTECYYYYYYDYYYQLVCHFQ